jgi:hypothetical protein
MTAPLPMHRFPLSFPPPLRLNRQRCTPRGFGGEVYSPTIQAGEQAAVSTATAVGSALGGPLGGAIASAISEIGVAIAQLWSGCGQTCVEATDYANQTGDLLTQNLQTYLSAPVHYASLQAAALQNFQTAWNALVQGCSNPALGSAGENCISARQQGACVYKTSPGGWQQVNGVWQYQYPGANGSGSTCWNYFVGFYDPIANDPTVVPDPVPGGSAVSSLVSSIGLNPSSTLFGLPIGDVLALAGILLVAAVVL